MEKLCLKDICITTRLDAVKCLPKWFWLYPDIRILWEGVTRVERGNLPNFIKHPRKITN